MHCVLCVVSNYIFLFMHHERWHQWNKSNLATEVPFIVILTSLNVSASLQLLCMHFTQRGVNVS